MKKLGYILSVLGVLFSTNIAEAQENYTSLKVEPGVAIPLSSNISRDKVGGSVLLRPEVNIHDVFSFGPSASFTGFSPNSDIPSIWTVGGGIRLKRAHSFEWNDSEGIAGVSPWVDCDLQYAIEKDSPNNFGYSIGIGASWAADADRVFWLGPFARYQTVQQSNHETSIIEPHLLIVGVSLEMDEPFKKPTKKLVIAEPPKPLKPTPTPRPQPQIVHENVTQEFKEVIQFAWDSDKLDKKATDQLDKVLEQIAKAKEFQSIKIEGHASSEGPVDHNNKLSQKRADSVLDYLSEHGVERSKLSAVGFGSSIPVATNTTEAGRILNRRAEFTLTFTVVVEKNKK